MGRVQACGVAPGDGRGVEKDQARARELHFGQKQELIPLEKARANRTPIEWKSEDIAQPEFVGVRVLEVRTMSVKAKPKRRGYTAGKSRHWKKAVVQLHPDDTIELFEGQEIGE